MMTDATSLPSQPPSVPPLPAEGLGTGSLRSAIGTALIRVIVPLWLVAGALFKLSDLNPNVLPAPVKDVVFATEDWVSLSRGDWLIYSMQAMVAVELVLVGMMILVPKLARPAAIFILTLFCLVLAFELANELQSSKFKKEGFAALLKPCGCFGAWSPPTIVTFMIDASLLVGCLVCPQSPKARAFPSARTATVALVLSLILGPTVAFARSKPAIEVVPTPNGTTEEGATKPNDPPTQPNNGSQTPPAPPTNPQANPAAEPWPAYPAKLNPNYFIAEKKSVGKPLASLPIAPLLAKVVPADFRTGRKTLILYRNTCDHCFDLMNTRFSGKLSTPTYSIQIPDSAGGKTYPNPCAECVKWELPTGPDYVIQSPLIMTIVDGVIAAICKDTDKPGALDATLQAWAPGHEKDSAVDGMLLAPMPAAAPSGGDAGAGTAKPAAKAFPPMPKLESVYAPDTNTWEGKRLDELDLPLIITRPIPLDLNSGEVVVMFYRVDCEHCEAVIIEHFAGDLGSPTLLVSIPDAMGDAFDNPCTECLKAALPAGPTYVVETPIVVVAKDGVVKHVFAGAQTENVEELRDALPKATGKR